MIFKKGLCKAFLQIVFVAGTLSFFFYGYVHLEGNARFFKSLHSAKLSREGRFLQALLKSEYPRLETFTALENTLPDDPIRIFQFQNKDRESFYLTRIQKDILCASCQNIDFLFLADAKGTIQKVKLLKPIEIDGKKVNAELFLKQFEGKSYQGPIVIGKDIENLAEAPSAAQGIADGILEALTKIRK